MGNDSNIWRLFRELESEIAKLQEDNVVLKEKIRQRDEQTTPALPSIRQVDWIELESGKRFLKKKELGRYLGLGVGTISNQMSRGVFPIRARRVGRSVRFDMREVLTYLETNQPFWERDLTARKK
jgi:predicted DNA-binding transcriptional regulator AlpA